jgi:hypothetical protein
LLLKLLKLQFLRHLSQPRSWLSWLHGLLLKLLKLQYLTLLLHYAYA